MFRKRSASTIIILRCNLRNASTTTTNIIFKDVLATNAYQPDVVENSKFEKWEKCGLFRPKEDADLPRWSMVLPPPNVTGKLHLGHALASTIQDVIARVQRSRGYNVLWVPGIDHAGIATQGVVEKFLKATKGVTRAELGREAFIDEVWKWKEEHGDTITSQLCQLGCSLDWDREVFTMNIQHTQAVYTAFKKLFDRRLIYRKEALVNWCPALKSTVSDIEVELKPIHGVTAVNIPGYEQPVKFGLMYKFVYKLYDSSDKIEVATTQPETMLGDTAIAVHPHDERYKKFHGKLVVNPINGRALPIITDEFVDMNFGTGAVKITPAHSKQDFDVAKKHNLPMIKAITEDGEMQNSGKFDGLKRYVCRDMVVDQLDKRGLLASVSPHSMVLPLCSRTGDVIDYLPKDQWFVSCSLMNEKAAHAVKTGQLIIEPEKHVDKWLQWCADDRDWCISRQLWWGHQVPAYKCSSKDSDSIWVAAEDPHEAIRRANVYLKTKPDAITAQRDSDVLDTWFSSAIYPFAALGWPESHYNKDFHNFYPLDIMVTGHDILGFWVHRMVMLGLELTERLPFSKVLLHGVICDSKGQKMSKSKGNVIDPIHVIQGISLEDLKDNTRELREKGIINEKEEEVAVAYQKSTFGPTRGIPKCGADALRFTLLSHDIKSHYLNFDVKMCHANTLFCNKIWQCVRYAKLCFGKIKDYDMEDVKIDKDDLTCFDQWILSKLQTLIVDVNKHNTSADFHLSTKALRKFLYNDLCDVYVEATKPPFMSMTEPKVIHAHAHTLSAVLNTSLRILSPYMVFLTDELIPKIPVFKENIIYNFRDDGKQAFEFPDEQSFLEWDSPLVEKKVEKLLHTAALVRELKGLCGMSNRLKPAMCVRTADIELKSDLVSYEPIILNLSKCKAIVFEDIESTTNRYIKGFIDFDTLVGVEVVSDNVEETISKAKNKLLSRIDKLEKQLNQLEMEQSSKAYIQSVTEDKKQRDRNILLEKKSELIRIQTDLDRLSHESSSFKTDDVEAK